MKRIVCFLIVLLMLTSTVLTSCISVQLPSPNYGNTENTPPNDSKDNEEDSGNENSDTVNAISKRFKVTRAQDMANPKFVSESCYKYGDDQYVFLFYLGSVDNVPLQDNFEPVNHTIYNTDYITEFKQFATTSEEITSWAQKVTKTCTNINTISTHGANLDVTNNQSGKVTLGITGGKAEAENTLTKKLSLYASYKKEVDITNITTIDNGYTKAVRSSSEKEVGAKIRFDKNSPLGYYRWIQLGKFDCFTYVYVNFKTGKAEINNVADLCESTYELDYSEDGKFSYNSTETLKFDESLLDNLTVPENVVDLSDKVDFTAEDILKQNTVLEKTKIYADSTLRNITDNGYYGLAQKGYETLDLSTYNKYMSDEYLFCFEVGIDITKKDSGYQEIYLYDNIIIDSSENYSIALANGMITGSIFAKDKNSTNKEYFYWYVRGDEIKNNMYIRYDASGSGDDTWVKNGIQVSLTIVSSLATQDNAYSNATERSITDTGVFGLGERSSELLDVGSFYNKYKQNGGSYAMMFDVSLRYKEKDDGYQEVYLYKQNNTTNSDSIEMEDAIKKGMLDRYDMNDGSGNNGEHTEYFCFNAVSVNQPNGIKDDICDSMYIRYDAHGNLNDTWIRISISVDYQIFVIPAEEYSSIANNALY